MAETFESAVEQAASDILKMLMDAMADPEGGVGIDQVIALIDGHLRSVVEARVKAEREAALRQAATRLCEWCARGLERDGNFHQASGEIGVHLCQGLDILALIPTTSHLEPLLQQARREAMRDLANAIKKVCPEVIPQIVSAAHPEEEFIAALNALDAPKGDRTPNG